MIQFFRKLKIFFKYKKNNLYIKLLSNLDRFGYLNIKKIRDIKIKKLFYFISLSGKEYTEMFNDVLRPSLLQNENLPKLKNLVVNKKYLYLPKIMKATTLQKTNIILYGKLKISVIQI